MLIFAQLFTGVPSSTKGRKLKFKKIWKKATFKVRTNVCFSSKIEKMKLIFEIEAKRH